MKNYILFIMLIATIAANSAGKRIPPPHPNVAEQHRAYPKQHSGLSPYRAPAQKKAPYQNQKIITGTEQILLVPVAFSDRAHPGLNQSLLDQFVDYYKEVSHNLYTPEFVIAPTVTSDRTFLYWGSDSSGIDAGADHEIYDLAREACEKLQQTAFDPTSYNLDKDSDGVVDHFMVIHAGNAQENGSSSDIWSHMWRIINGGDDDLGDSTPDGVQLSGNLRVVNYSMFATTSPLGIMVHEFGHDLGWVDLYSIRYTNNGIGNWGLMAMGCWNGPTYNGESPAWPCAYNRYWAGWVTPQDITSQSGSFTLEPCEGANDKVYKLTHSSTEYFLLENRRRIGFDEWIPKGDSGSKVGSGGMLIWHIDEQVLASGWLDNDVQYNASHKGVDLEEADEGNLDRTGSAFRGDAGDPFPGTGNKTEFSPNSSPSSDSYSSSIISALMISDIAENGNDITFTKSGNFGYLTGVYPHPLNSQLKFVSVYTSTAMDGNSLTATVSQSGNNKSVTMNFLSGSSMYLGTYELETTNAHSIILSGLVSGATQEAELNISGDGVTKKYLAPEGGAQ